MKRGFTLSEILIALGIIGVVAAITQSTLIKNYQKHVTVNKLKKAYSELYQAVNMSVNDNDAVENWDFTLSTEDFVNKYITPYLKYRKEGSNYFLNNGSKINYSRISLSGGNQSLQIIIDINGKQSPNINGKDRFYFYIFPRKKALYNVGLGDIAKNVKSGGLYPDGYGYDRNTLKTNSWRGCNRRGDNTASGSSNGLHETGAFCTALIMYDGWKISEDYNW